MGRSTKKTRKINILKQALKSHPNDLQTVSSLLGEYLQKKEFNQALKYSLQYHSKFPGEPFYCHVAATCLANTDRQSEALEYYTKAEALYKSQSNSASQLGDLYCELGDIYTNIDTYRAYYYYKQALQYNLSLDKAKKSYCSILENFIINSKPGNWFLKGDWSILYYLPDAAPNSSVINLSIPDASTLRDEQEYSTAVRKFCTDYSQLLDNTSINELPSLINIMSDQSFQKLLTTKSDEFNALLSALYNTVYKIFPNNMQNSLYIPPEMFILPPLFKRYGWVLPKSQQLCASRHRLETAAKAANINFMNQYAIRVTLLLIDSFAGDPDKALQEFLSEWQSNSFDALYYAMSTQIWRTLYKSNWRIDGSFAWLHTVFSSYIKFYTLHDECFFKSKYFLTYNLLEYTIKSPEEWNKFIFEALILPGIRQSLQDDDYLTAIALAEQTDLGYAQQPPTTEHSETCWNAYLPWILDTARALNHQHPLSTAPYSTAKTVTVGFVVSMKFNPCAPIRILEKLLAGFMRMQPRLIIPKVYVITTYQEQTVKVFERLGVEVVVLNSIRGPVETDNFLQRLLYLRHRMQEDGVGVMVYTHCTVGFCAFSAALGLSPLHVLFSMGGHYRFRMDEIQGYITGGAGRDKDIFYGYEWRCASGKVADYAGDNPELDRRAQEIRQHEFARFQVVLGCIGRPQKIDNDDFMDMLENILQTNPGAAFLWFGEQALAGVVEKIHARGIQKQCFFQGYVDTKLYGRVLDIHLDSFPMPAGLTMMESMSAGTPAVFYLSEEARQSGMLFNMYPIFQGHTGEGQAQRFKEIFNGPDGENLFFCAHDRQQYREFVQKLIDDSVLRRHSGLACQAFMETFMNDDIAPARNFTKHILELIEENRHLGTQKTANK